MTDQLVKDKRKKRQLKGRKRIFKKPFSKSGLGPRKTEAKAGGGKDGSASSGRSG